MLLLIGSVDVVIFRVYVVKCMEQLFPWTVLASVPSCRHFLLHRNHRCVSKGKIESCLCANSEKRELEGEIQTLWNSHLHTWPTKCGKVGLSVSEKLQNSVDAAPRALGSFKYHPLSVTTWSLVVRILKQEHLIFTSVKTITFTKSKTVSENKRRIWDVLQPRGAISPLLSFLREEERPHRDLINQTCALMCHRITAWCRIMAALRW